MHVFLLYAKDGVRPAEEHDPAVLSLHLDVAELLSYDLFGVSVDHLVSGHVGPPVFRPIVCAISLLRGARLILRFTQATALSAGPVGPSVPSRAACTAVPSTLSCSSRTARESFR